MVDAGTDVYNCITAVDFEVQIVSVTCQLVYGYFFCCACLDVLLFIFSYLLVCSSCFILGFDLVAFCICCMIFYLLTICNLSPNFSRLFQGLEFHSSRGLCCHGFKTFSRYFNVVASCILNRSIILYVYPYLHLVVLLDCLCLKV